MAALPNNPVAQWNSAVLPALNILSVPRGVLSAALAIETFLALEFTGQTAMAFIFDEHTEPDLQHWRQSVRFCMVDGRERATCQIGYATLNELEPDAIETGRDCLDRFHLYRGVIATAAARLLAAGAHGGGTVVQIMRANLV